MDRRALIISAAGAGLALGGMAAPARAALAATDDELAYANFGLATEFLLKDFYARTAAAKLFAGAAAREVARGGLNAGEHATALAALLTDGGQPPAVEEDFEFNWPAKTFATRTSAAKAGVGITRPLLGAYLDATSTISIPSYRTLFASLSANLAQQLGALSRQAGGRIVGTSFPTALDVETASAAIEAYLG